MIDENLVFSALDGHETSLWSLLFASGYLKAENPILEGVAKRCQISSPNHEVTLLFKAIVKEWFTDHMGSEYLFLLKDLTEGHIDIFAKRLKKFLEESTSYFDTTGHHPEKFYHGFVLGLISSLEKTHTIKSNRESGYGRYDIMIIPKDTKKCGIILEFKTAENEENLSQAAEEALQQIKNKNYAIELRQQGLSQLVSVGLAFQGKKVSVVFEHHTQS